MTSGRAHVRVAAVRQVAESLSRFAVQAVTSLSAFETQIGRCRRQAAEELASRQRELAVATRALASADERSAAACRARVERAEAAVNAAARALRAIEVEHGRARAVIRRYLGELDRIAASSLSDARAIEAEIDAYAAAVGSGAALSSSVGTGASQASTTSRGGIETVLQEHGLELVDVDAPDYSGNPILGWGDAMDADFRWAVETWEEHVSHEAGRGATHEDLEARDQVSGASGYRRLAGVWDMFIADPIVLDEDDAGRLTVIGGRHRLEAARQLGVRRLPARVRRGRR